MRVIQRPLIEENPFLSQRVQALLTSAVATVMLTAAALHTYSPRHDVSTILK